MLVATMSQDVTLDVTEAIRQRVQLAAARGQLGILGLGLYANLLRLRRRFGRVEREVSALDVRTEEDRSFLREFARGYQEVAESLDSYRDQLETMRPPFFGAVLARLFDALVVSAEDIAETAALGASAEFADLVKEDLKGHRTAQTDG